MAYTIFEVDIFDPGVQQIRLLFDEKDTKMTMTFYHLWHFALFVSTFLFLLLPFEIRLFFVRKGSVQVLDVRRFVVMLLSSASLFLQRSEMCFHCCAHISKGALPEIVVLIYEKINFWAF